MGGGRMAGGGSKDQSTIQKAKERALVCRYSVFFHGLSANHDGRKSQENRVLRGHRHTPSSFDPLYSRRIFSPLFTPVVSFPPLFPNTKKIPKKRRDRDA
mmetsp:Transcript_29712/g.76732  ORF Transcript_29712/g.76732 Transcript_29712/m.76732 type:complete len:100 (+) Transcript_29712:2112-2411(+)